MKPWRTLSSRTAFESRWLTVHEDSVETNKGLTIDDFYTVSISDAVIIVPVDLDGNVILKEEYRYSVRASMLEVPAGMIDREDADALSAARRELSEETGFVSDHWIELGEAVPETSKLTSRFKIFLALDCSAVRHPHPDAAEDIRVLVIPFPEAIERVIDGRITSSITAHALLLAGRRLKIL